MQKPTKLTGLYIIGIIICIGIGVLIGMRFGGNSVEAQTSAPGTIEDPLVSKSYVDMKVADAISDIEIVAVTPEVLEPTVEAPAEETPNVQQPTTGVAPALFVVEFVMAGQSLIVEESGEVILRSGSATAIGNAGGNGISDVTSGIDIMDGEDVPWNHLIIIPRTDGRGLYITSDAYIMVKGHYSIEY